MARITDMLSDLQIESSGWLFKSSLAKSGRATGRTTCSNIYMPSWLSKTPLRPHSHHLDDRNILGDY